MQQPTIYSLLYENDQKTIQSMQCQIQVHTHTIVRWVMVYRNHFFQKQSISDSDRQLLMISNVTQHYGHQSLKERKNSPLSSEYIEIKIMPLFQVPQHMIPYVDYLLMKQMYFQFVTKSQIQVPCIMSSINGFQKLNDKGVMCQLSSAAVKMTSDMILRLQPASVSVEGRQCHLNKHWVRNVP